MISVIFNWNFVLIIYNPDEVVADEVEAGEVKAGEVEAGEGEAGEVEADEDTAPCIPDRPGHQLTGCNQNI